MELAFAVTLQLVIQCTPCDFSYGAWWSKCTLEARSSSGQTYELEAPVLLDRMNNKTCWEAVNHTRQFNNHRFRISDGAGLGRQYTVSFVEAPACFVQFGSGQVGAFGGSQLTLDQNLTKLDSLDPAAVPRSASYPCPGRGYTCNEAQTYVTHLCSYNAEFLRGFNGKVLRLKTMMKKER